PALAGIARRLRRDLLADARRLYLGDRRSLPAVRRRICRDQPRHSAFQFQSTLGSALGYFCLWRTARPPFLHLFTSGWRLLAHDARSRRRCIFFGFRRGDRKSTRLNSSHVSISYAVFCLKKKTY